MMSMIKMIQENDEKFKELNTVDTNEIECPLHNEGNTHLIHSFCAQNENRIESSSSHNAFLQHVHNL